MSPLAYATAYAMKGATALRQNDAESNVRLRRWVGASIYSRTFGRVSRLAYRGVVFFPGFMFDSAPTWIPEDYL